MRSRYEIKHVNVQQVHVAYCTYNQRKQRLIDPHICICEYKPVLAAFFYLSPLKDLFNFYFCYYFVTVAAASNLLSLFM